MTQAQTGASLRLIKKYPNRRLYDTRTSTYITLADVKQLVLANEALQVVDAKSAEDSTRSILLQIILEEESGGMPIPVEHAVADHPFLRPRHAGHHGLLSGKEHPGLMEIQQRMAEQSKGLYGSQFGPEAWAQFMNVQTPMLQNMMNNYIDQSKNLFVQMQDQMQDQTRAMFSTFPFTPGGAQGGGRKSDKGRGPAARQILDQPARHCPPAFVLLDGTQSSINFRLFRFREVSDFSLH